MCLKCVCFFVFVFFCFHPSIHTPSSLSISFHFSILPPFQLFSISSIRQSTQPSPYPSSLPSIVPPQPPAHHPSFFTSPSSSSSFPCAGICIDAQIYYYRLHQFLRAGRTPAAPPCGTSVLFRKSSVLTCSPRPPSSSSSSIVGSTALRSGRGASAQAQLAPCALIPEL